MQNSIPLFEISWGRNEVRNVVDSVTRGSHWANGPYVDQFEEQIESYLGIEHAVVFNSGTTALVSSLEAAGIGPGDEVIVPSFTFISTVNAVRLVGANPVFADIERDTYGLDPQSVEAVISECTAGMIPVHYAGAPCQLEPLLEIATERDLVLIEDAAEAFGATHENQPVGTLGDAGMYSFCQNKVISTGEGGAIVTGDQDHAEKLRLLRSHGRATSDYFGSSGGGEYTTIGNNLRMPDVAAAIGVGQMERIDDLIESRREVASRYSKRLEPVSGVEPMGDPPFGRHVYQLYTVTLSPDIDREHVINELADAGVSSKVYFDPVHKSRYYRETYDESTAHLDTTEQVSGHVLSLPMHADLSAAEINYVVGRLADAIS